MAKCAYCSAPLPHSSIFCEYCGSRNDIDLGAKKFKNIRPHLDRKCPTCKIALDTIDVGDKIPFFVERCHECYGLFFDKGELEELVGMSVKTSQNVDVMKLAELSENPRHIDVITYRKCPVCDKMMQRVNFMKQSGVVTDVCQNHGIWLDSGELRHILEWVKSGGIEKMKASKKDDNIQRHHYKESAPDVENANIAVDIIELIGNILFRSYR